MKSRKGIFRTGTSNIIVPVNKQSYPLDFKGKSRLNYYSSFFDSVEINSSFYKLPMPATFEKWSNDVPGNFRFSVKLSKEITHAKNLKIDFNLIKQFLESAGKLGNKKSCLLVQFPGSLTVEYYNQVEALLSKIKENNKENKWKIAVEFRNASWYIPETFEMMDNYKASVVLHDFPKGRNKEVNKMAPFIFIRFHGPAGDYRGSYSDESLNIYAEKIRSWLMKGKDVYAYFNNTIGNAFENARYLQEILIKK